MTTLKLVKPLLFFALLLFFGLATAYADKRERPIMFDELPQDAQEFLTTHFHDLTLAFIVEERKVVYTQYEVTYTDLTEVDFRSDGSWKSVERSHAAVPAAIVPKPIADFVQGHELIRSQRILKIEHNPYTWEIGLSGGLEIKFDSEFNVIGYDD